MAKFYYGGQAVMEGVMMRGRQSVAVAIRRPEGDIAVYQEPLTSKLYQSKFCSLAFLRGIIALWEMLVLGTRIMMLSAKVAFGDATADPLEIIPSQISDDQSTARQSNPDGQNNAEKHPPIKKGLVGNNGHDGIGSLCSDKSESGIGEQSLIGDSLMGNNGRDGIGSAHGDKSGGEQPQIGNGMIFVTLLLSLAFAIGLFFVTPILITSLLRHLIGDGWLNLAIEGIIRLLLLIGYFYLIGRIPDIQRVFGYHGAEHKAINALENGDPLDIPHVRRASRVHTRCGTGFLLIVMVVSVFVFALIGSPSLLIKIGSRIVLVPILAGIAYELIRLGAANYRYRLVRWLLAPSLALQGLTTLEPDDSMIECAIISLQRVRSFEESNALPEQSEIAINSALAGKSRDQL